MKVLYYLKEIELEGKTKFLMILGFCLLFSLSLIIANVPYMDDTTRMDNGLGQWEIEGRPLTSLLLMILNFNINPIYNIGPIPLIVGNVFFAFAVYYSTNKMDLKNNVINIIPFTLLICNPFFIQNLSYQFDSIGNIFSVGCVLFSFFYKNTSKIKTFIIKVLLLICVSCLYQPTSNMYLAIFFMNIIFQYKKTNDHFLKSVAYHAGIYCIASIIYYIGCKMAFTYLYTEIAFRSNLIDMNFNSFKHSISYSIRDFLDMCSSFEGEKIYILAQVAFVMLFINIIGKIFNTFKVYNSYNRIFLTIGILLTPLMLIMSIWGPFILLKEVFFNPRDFPSIGVFFMMGALSFSLIDKKGYINIIFISLTLLSVLGFSFVYGSALNQDNNYKRYVYDSIAMKMEDIHQEVGDKKIHVYGRNTTSSFVRLALVEHPFIYRLIFADNTNFFKTYNIGARNIQNIQGGFVLDNLEEWHDICDNNIKPIVNNSNYDIFNFKEHISIWFKRTPKFCDNYPLETDIHFSRKQDMYEFKYNH